MHRDKTLSSSTHTLYYYIFVARTSRVGTDQGVREGGGRMSGWDFQASEALHNLVFAALGFFAAEIWHTYTCDLHPPQNFRVPLYNIAIVFITNLFYCSLFLQRIEIHHQLYHTTGTNIHTNMKDSTGDTLSKNKTKHFNLVNGSG